jgi:hypothetical protein
MAIRQLWASVFAVFVLALVPTAALGASAGDAAATQALARATDTLVRAANPDIPKGLASARRFGNAIAAQCPHAAAGSPQNGQSEQLDDELIGGMTIAGYSVAAAPIAHFKQAVRGLHWSNNRLTRAVSTFADKLQKLATLKLPNVCGDIQAWADSGYKTLPASTVPFVHHYLQVTPEAEEVPLIIQLVGPYATNADFPILRRVERLETRLGEAEAAAVETYSHIIITLELNQ